MKRPIKPSRDRSRFKIISKYFKMFRHFTNYGGIRYLPQTLRRGISARRLKQFQNYLEKLQ